mmetsp:Transcript_102487/g.182072  ORF Transcript_102487/g.182072 Transcript_102487/m.182072 type:complete len:236 (+) Transcript_102487:61-768(+)
MGCSESKPDVSTPTVSANRQTRARTPEDGRIEGRNARREAAMKHPSGSTPGAPAQSVQDKPAATDTSAAASSLRRYSHGGADVHIRREILKLQYREVIPEDYELLCMLDESLPKRNTASAAAVQGIPLVLADGIGRCQVCFGDIQDGSKIPQLPCGHACFHLECASKWLTCCAARCPVCQVSLSDDPLSQATSQPTVVVAESRNGSPTASPGAAPNAHRYDFVGDSLPGSPQSLT